MSSRDSFRAIATRYGLSKAAVGRHKGAHLKRQLARASPVVAATLARKCRVEARRKYSEPINIFTLTLLDSGNRKTATVQAVTGPLAAIEADLLASTEPEIAAAESRRRICEAELTNHERDAARFTANTEERERTMEERMLAERFGGRWDQYRQGTRRWV